MPNSPNFNTLSLAELESLCGKHLVEFYRKIYRNPVRYRTELLEFLTQPKLPIGEVLDVIRRGDQPFEAWQSVLTICRQSAPAAAWGRLPQTEIESDIVEARGWLATQVAKMGAVTGLYLGLDTLNMRNGIGRNLEIGGSKICDPARESKEWVGGKLMFGSDFLIRGLNELHQEYSREEWGTPDKAIAGGSAFSFADYILFLGYSGIVLGHALARLEIDRLLLAIWGFNDGDLFLLGRRTTDAFIWLAKSPSA